MVAVTHLIDGAGNETGNVLLAKEDVRERAAERRSSLDGRETDLAYTRTVIEAEYALDLVEGHALLYEAHVSVELGH